MKHKHHKTHADNLSAGDVVDVRCAVIGVIRLYFASAENLFPILATSVAKSNNRPTSEEVGQCRH